MTGTHLTRSVCMAALLAWTGASLAPTAAQGQAAAPATTAPADSLALGAARLLAVTVPAADDPDADWRTIFDPEVGKTAAGESFLDLARPLLRQVQDAPAAVGAIDRFLASDPHPLAASVARSMRLELQLQLGTATADNAVKVYGDYVRRLVAVGPFGDEEDYYTGVVFPPEFGFPRRDQVMTGRLGPVKPRTVERSPFTSFIRLQAPGNQDEGCYYGLYRFRNDGPVTGYVELTTTGSFELFLDGRKLTVLDRLVDQTKLAVQRIPLQVGAGDATHQLLIKTTLEDNSQLALRFLDARGAPLTGLTEVFDEPIGSPPSAPADQAEVPKLGPFVGGLALLEQRAAKLDGQTSDAAHAIRIATTIAAARGRTAGRALAALRRIEATPPPQGTPLELAYARATQATGAIPEPLRRSKADEIVERVAKAVPEHFSAAMSRARQLADRDQKEAAIRLLRGRIDAGHGGPSTYYRLHELLRGIQAHAECRQLREQWYEALPNDARVAQLIVAQQRQQGAMTAALATLQTALERAPNNQLRSRMLSLAREHGDRDLAMQMIDQLQVRDPDGPAKAEEHGFLLERLEPTGSAWLDAYRRVATHPRAYLGHITRAAMALLRGGDRAGAITAYRRALAKDPSDDEIRRTLARLDSQGPEAKTVDADFATFRRDAKELIAKFEPGKAETTATSTLVLDQRLISFAPDGSMIQETHLVRRINDRKGVEEYQNASRAAEADELLELRTLLYDPKADQDAGRATWQEYRPTLVSEEYGMPRLDPGAFVESRFRDNYARTSPTRSAAASSSSRRPTAH